MRRRGSSSAPVIGAMREQAPGERGDDDVSSMVNSCFSLSLVRAMGLVQYCPGSSLASKVLFSIIKINKKN